MTEMPDQTTGVPRGSGALATVIANLVFGWVWWLIAVGDHMLGDARFNRWVWPLAALGALQVALAGVLYFRTRWKRAAVGVLWGVVISFVLEFAILATYLVSTQR